MKRTAILVIIGLFVLVGIIYLLFSNAPTRSMPGSKLVDISKTWNLPGKLNEISGITYLRDGRIACIQDEEGVIFIYNLKTSTIDKEIIFESVGDFEGIAVVNTTAYALRSDGVLFEISNFLSENFDVSSNVKYYQFEAEEKYNFEGLTFDKKYNRLLLAVKDDTGLTKPVYSFDLDTRTFKTSAVISIDLSDPVFDVLEQDLSHQLLRPSEIAIHPRNGNIYVLDGTNPKLLILNSKGKAVKLHVFKEEQFAQPEGLAFDHNGSLFISNESNSKDANILKVDLQ